MGLELPHMPKERAQVLAEKYKVENGADFVQFRDIDMRDGPIEGEYYPVLIYRATWSIEPNMAQVLTQAACKDNKTWQN